MAGTWNVRHRRSSWAIGLLVLAGLAASIHHMLRSDQRRGPASLVAAVRQEPAAVAPLLPLTGIDGGGPPKVLPRHAVAGVVHLPDSRPAGGATVTLYRAATAWPEWRLERIDQAFTGADGAFQFRCDPDQGLVLGFEHPDFAGGLAEVSALREHMQLQLEPAFELYGVVYNDSGLPVPNARVAVESILSDQRRAQAVATSANGRYRFTNLAAGPVRLVARHESWQPAAYPVVVVGDQVRVDLRFERPTMAPLRGRVMSAVSQEPIAGALVEVLPSNSQLGLVDPISAITGDDGTFLLSGLSRGNMRVIVRQAEHGAVIRTEAIGVLSSDLVFEMPPRSVVTGQLAGEQGSPPFAGGEVLRVRDIAGQIDYTAIDKEGRFRFAAPLSPGLATLQALGSPFAFERSLSSEIQFRIRETPETEIDLGVVPPAVVHARLVDEAGAGLAGGIVMQTRVLAENARSIGAAAVQFDLGAVGNQVAQLFGAYRDEMLAVSAADGTFEIRGQKPGLLLARVDLAGYGSPWFRVVVPQTGTTTENGDIVLPRGCRIRGRVLRGDRGLAGASVTVVGGDSQAMVVTAADGSFVADNLLPGDYRVRARLPSQPVGSGERLVSVQPGRRIGDVILRLEAGRMVRGSVSGSDGQPVSGALVAVRGALGQTTITDGAGDFLLELPERAIELQVWLGDRSQQRVVPVLPGQERVSVRLDTPPTCTLLASVSGLPSKKRLSGALVRVTDLDGGSDATTRSRWVDMPNGEMRWPLCPVGRVRLQIWSEGYVPFVVDRDLAANDVANLGEVLLEPGGRLQGVVQDDHGAAIANAFVFLGDETDLDLFEPMVRTGADGTFRLSGVSSRSSHLVARAAGFAARGQDLQLPYDVLSGSPLVVRLERGAVIEVSLVGEGAEGALVQLRRQGRLLASTELDERGRAWFTNRGAGSYTVQIFGSDLPPQTVVVEPGASTVRVRFP
ncbi:MAG TPA: carboxypeptidase regulatory-like domain-containing protein [Planctomycetota bacterium]|nr:carboxypeptidase regulatory-like domain-containing protein [Planctomycetota bacterium]